MKRGGEDGLQKGETPVQIMKDEREDGREDLVFAWLTGREVNIFRSSFVLVNLRYTTQIKDDATHPLFTIAGWGEIKLKIKGCGRRLSNIKKRYSNLGISKGASSSTCEREHFVYAYLKSRRGCTHPSQCKIDNRRQYTHKYFSFFKEKSNIPHPE